MKQQSLDDTGRWLAVNEEQRRHVSAIESARERARAAWRRSQPATAHRILVVDDHESFRGLVAEILGDYTVRTCMSAEEALVELRAREYDLLVADLDLPGGLNGEQLTYEVRRQSRRPQIPVLLVTGFEDEATLEATAERVHAVGYFRKPFNLEEFRARVRALLTGNGEALP